MTLDSDILQLFFTEGWRAGEGKKREFRVLRENCASLHGLMFVEAGAREDRTCVPVVFSLQSY